MTTISSLHFQIPAGGVPDWVHLTPAGTFSGVDGRGPFTLNDAAAVIATSMAAGRLAIDENHAIDVAGPKGQPSPARGWIVEMQLRDDGIWGRVEWTASGRALMEDKAYRGISPVLVAEKEGGRVVKLLRAALTNDPNLTLTTLHSRTPDMDFIAKLRSALGLKADAAEADVLTAVTSHAATVTAYAALLTAAGLKADAAPADLLAQVTAHAADAGKLTAISAHFTKAGLDLAKMTPSELETHLQAKGAGDEAELRRTVVSLQSQLTTLQQDGAKEKAIAFVDGAIKAGKQIKPLRDHYIARHQKDAAAVETEINGMLSLNAGGIVRPAQPEGGALDADELATCELMGLDPKKFAESKAALEKVAG
jgi:phage I-like protein